VEATYPQEARVNVRSEESAGQVVIAVEDAGAGMDPRVQRRALDPFFSTKVGHDGLGLYFCRLIVERNAGSIEIRSLPGGGTRVAVLLPTSVEAFDDSPEKMEAL
jgi:two-component system C4-dicarboxylate transport sensor histidine kinase DctB